MAISYENFRAGNSKVQAYEGRVLGFLTTDYETMTETRFAIFNDGRMMMSAPVALRTPAANHFTAKSWTHVFAIPATAEFCGHYVENLKA